MTLHQIPYVAVAVIIASSIIGHSQASVFTPDCAPPPPGTSFVTTPTVRSTMTIVWNCLSILFLCTWSIQHLNVPKYRKKPTTFAEKRWDDILDFLPKAKWMIITVLMPEYLVSKAFGEWIGVKDGLRAARTGVFTPPSKGWGELHIYLANAGYFVLDTKREETTNTKSVSFGSGTTLDVNEAMLRGRRFWALNQRQWEEVASQNFADLPNIDETELKKLSHGSAATIDAN
ncbi:hypothetical protein TWF481_006730 [Arthrobotrys musiformis]|uniref:Uncharacterized protein n=1 Tax=Arthrobotrys musiformis TaxID=47236 RepID=A0AAV9WBA6_9PEZI